MKKLVKLLLILLVVLTLPTGCFKRDDMENIKVYTTVYPITYIIDKIYGDYSEISSIFPNGADVYTYELTDKQINDYSKGDLFIYNGLSDEKIIARRMINKNKNMRIIDVSYGLKVNYNKEEPEELWLSPNNFLMLATTIKDNLESFIKSSYIKEIIDKNYASLQEEVSQMDAELRLIGSASKDKGKNTIIVGSNTLQFLENYGFNVISLENEKNITNELKNDFKSKKYQYILIKDNKESENVKKIINDYGAKTVNVYSMNVLTDEQVKNSDNYINIMKQFLKELSNIAL